MKANMTLEEVKERLRRNRDMIARILEQPDLGLTYIILRQKSQENEILMNLLYKLENETKTTS